MSERKGLQVVAGLLLVVAGIFACYLASQAVRSAPPEDRPER